MPHILCRWDLNLARAVAPIGVLCRLVSRFGLKWIALRVALRLVVVDVDDGDGSLANKAAH